MKSDAKCHPVMCDHELSRELAIARIPPNSPDFPRKNRVFRLCNRALQTIPFPARVLTGVNELILLFVLDGGHGLWLRLAICATRSIA